MSTSRTLGVVIGRFQVPQLHEGHHHLIGYARDRHEQVLILVGSPRGFPTPRNPLSFSLRRAMILLEYPDATVMEIHDHPSDIEWSKRVDEIVKVLFPEMQATLYGSRDSFLHYYSGVHPVVEVPTIPCTSGSELRNWIKQNPLNTSDFRHGVIHAQTVRAPMPYPTVDVAVVNREKKAVLLGQKPTDGGLYRFLGGFYDPLVDTSLESAAHREVWEEAGMIEVADFRYLGSRKVNDWRYRGSDDCIVTTLFRADYMFGAPRAMDDIASVAWFPFSEVSNVLVPEHKPLGEMLLRSLNHSKELS